MKPDRTPEHIKIDERNHVEKPLLDQLKGLGWEIWDLGRDQKPSDTHRETFNEVVMLPVLREQIKVINPWLEDDQVEEVTKRLTASFPTAFFPSKTWADFRTTARPKEYGNDYPYC